VAVREAERVAAASKARVVAATAAAALAVAAKTAAAAEAEADALERATAGGGEGGSSRAAGPSEVGAASAQLVLTLADVPDITGRNDVPESSLGGVTTCIVCMSHPKSHLAVPCGHQSVCGTCAERIQLCPYCRAPVQVWVQHRMV